MLHRALVRAAAPLHSPTLFRTVASAAGTNDEAILAHVKQRWKQARLAKDAQTATVLGGILTDLQYAGKAKQQANQKPPSIVKMLQKGIKKRTDAAKVFRNATPQPRMDLAEKEEGEIALLQELLPK
ncbi:hypothetical protein MVES1_003119 [Malassezia vespertilionis]|uniref:Altered inheritance of mitochondria protein 41 n=1 Tax=Malassezia vespertilionis TaxID=2020962 RepID=A0A2N1J9N3_9BASI|nr:uncharacterized protein MVES1_003119 [Malassezia vespertilionis]PKI83255.1 hypothetical protein MVES_002959 [Malassezia vespertilionis]WFD07749.1 hypothetical protein MVES1_003119 [Malassezia vespertilionis]